MSSDLQKGYGIPPMEWIERLNQAVRYIEEHLTEKINYEQLGKIACCSPYHFQRMFVYMAGLPLSEYIRRRRMSLAAVDLLDGEETVTDIALKYGYSSPTAFNRAFQTVHGLAPSRTRKEGAAIKSFPPITFKITIKGAEELNYRIENHESFRIVGIAQPLYKELEKNFSIVPKMWQDASVNGTVQKLAGYMDAQPMGLLGVSDCNTEAQGKYMIAVASTHPKGEFEEFIITAATWAIFPGAGSNLSVQELEKRIVTEWLPTSGYEYGSAPDLEVYLNPDPQNAKYEVWIPAVKRQQP